MTPAPAAGGPGASSGAGACADVTHTARSARLGSARSLFHVHRRQPQTSQPTSSPRSGRTSACASARAPRPFLLESVERGRLGRYSFVGCGSRLVELRRGRGARRAGRRLPRLRRRRASSSRPCRCPTTGRASPESRFVVPELLVRFDHARGIAEVLVGDPQQVARACSTARSPSCRAAPGRRGQLRRFPDRDEHLRRVERAKEHIREGDVFQVVIAQRAERPTSASALELYRALRRVNPSPYLFLLELDDLALVGSSPETVVKCEGRARELNPIAGTIAPGEGDAEALLSSEKDRAEHVMLVDLGRNDLSRVCVPGTVASSASWRPERYSHVTHLVSEVVGELREGCTPFELLRACFPAGTVSGAPKVRAMQIISELEGYRRGVYAGAVGYVFPQQRRARHVHRDPHARAARRRRVPAGGRRDRRRLRSGRRAPGMPEQARRARGARSSSRSGRAAMILLIDNYDSFTYNLAHLFGALGVEVKVLRNDEITADEAERLAPSHLVDLPRSRPARGRRRLDRHRPPARADDADARRLPRPPGDRRGVRRRGRLRARAAARQGEPREARRDGPLHRPARAVRRRPLPLARRDAAARRARADRVRRRRRGDGRAPPHAADRRRAVPSRVGADARRAGARRATSSRGACDPGALGTLLDGRDLTRDEARERDERDHARRGDAGADRRLPRRAAREGRDRRRDRRLRRGDARARAARAADSAPTSSTPRAPAATARTRSTSRPPRRSSRPRAGAGVAKHGNRAASSQTGCGGRARGARLRARPRARSGSSVDRRARLRLPVRAGAPSGDAARRAGPAGARERVPSSTCSAR